MELGFLLKKFLSAFLMPLSFSLLIFLLGLFYLYKKSYTKAKVCLSMSFVLILLFSNASFSNSILFPLEKQYKQVSFDEKAKYILLLGGDYEKRAYEALRLYYLNKGSKIITSGYEGRGKVPEALLNANKLISLGIPKEDIIMQTKPRDTKEEALNIKTIVKKERFFLVTSAYHMKRAMLLFEEEGLNVIAAPSNFLVKQHSSFFLPRASNLEKTEVSIHEYLGLLWQEVKKIIN